MASKDKMRARDAICMSDKASRVKDEPLAIMPDEKDYDFVSSRGPRQRFKKLDVIFVRARWPRPVYRHQAARIIYTPGVLSFPRGSTKDGSRATQTGATNRRGKAWTRQPPEALEAGTPGHTTHADVPKVPRHSAHSLKFSPTSACTNLHRTTTCKCG
jgi:hypothetical protein